jgi:hypothetical protein
MGKPKCRDVLGLFTEARNPHLLKRMMTAEDNLVRLTLF